MLRLKKLTITSLFFGMALLIMSAPTSAQEIDFENYKEMRFDLTFGLGHDSNILLSRTGDLTHATPTENADARFRAKAHFGLNMFMERASRLDLEAFTDYTYSNKAEFSFADPWEFHFLAPWRNNYGWGDFVLTPQINTLLQDSNISGTRDNVMNRFGAKVAAETNMSSSRELDYYLEAWWNASSDPVPADDNADGYEVLVGVLQSLATDSASTGIFEFWLELSTYQSEGVNPKYDKVLVGLGYSDNFFFQNSSWTAKLESYFAEFPESQIGRKDSHTSFALEIFKSINANWDWGIGGSFMSNTSKTDSINYDRWQSATFVTYKWLE